MSMCNYYAPESGASLGIMIQPLGRCTCHDVNSGAPAATDDYRHSGMNSLQVNGHNVAGHGRHGHVGANQLKHLRNPAMDMHARPMVKW